MSVTYVPPGGYAIHKDYLYTQCRHCWRDIYTLQGTHSWQHLANKSVYCNMNIPNLTANTAQPVAYVITELEEP